MRTERGFTLIELLAVIIVGGIVLAALTSFYLQEQRALKQQQIQVETSQALRVALEQITRDLRAAGRNPLGTAGVGLTYADATSVLFSLDKDWDGVASSLDRDESKGFRLQDTSLQTYIPGTSLGGWNTLADFMEPNQTVFRYYRADDTPVTSLPADAADLAAITRIDITLTVTNRVPGAPDINRTETATVQLRNRS